MSETTAITKALQTYFDGLYEGDTDKLRQVFLKSCALTYAQDGQVVSIPRDDWFAAVDARAKPKEAGLSRHDDILTIDILDAHTAFAKVKCAIPPRYFTDLLCLLKIDGHWQVAQKVSAVELRAQ